MAGAGAPLSATLRFRPAVALASVDRLVEKAAARITRFDAPARRLVQLGFYRAGDAADAPER